MRILEFTHFVDFMTFNRLGDYRREKELVRKISVAVVFELKTMDTKSEGKSG